MGSFRLSCSPLVVVLATTLTDHDVVSSRADQRSVDLGQPLAWLHQDESALDPPLPGRFGMASPWDTPTSVSGVAFLVDVLVAFAVVTVLGLLVSALMVALSRQLRSLRRV